MNTREQFEAARTIVEFKGLGRYTFSRRERRKGGKANRWRRCIYCGQFVSYADLDEGKAKVYTSTDAEGQSESTECWHVKCAKEGA